MVVLMILWIMDSLSDVEDRGMLLYFLSKHDSMATAIYDLRFRVTCVC